MTGIQSSINTNTSSTTAESRGYTLRSPRNPVNSNLNTTTSNNNLLSTPTQENNISQNNIPINDTTQASDIFVGSTTDELSNTNNNMTHTPTPTRLSATTSTNDNNDNANSNNSDAIAHNLRSSSNRTENQPTMRMNLRQMNRNTSYALVLPEIDDTPATVPARPTSQKIHPEVTTIVWSLDDTKLIVANKPGIISVWDTRTGKLDHKLRGHESSIFVLRNHPCDNQIILSAGYDGLIFLWNIITGEKIAEYRIPTGAAIADGAFSHDGTYFAILTTTSICTLYGVGKNKTAYQKTPLEQFFKSEIRGELIFDANLFVIDAQTQRPPHLLRERVVSSGGLHTYSEYTDVNYGKAFPVKIPEQRKKKELYEKCELLRNEIPQLQLEKTISKPKPIDKKSFYKRRTMGFYEDENEEEAINDIPIVYQESSGEEYSAPSENESESEMEFWDDDDEDDDGDEDEYKNSNNTNNNDSNNNEAGTSTRGRKRGRKKSVSSKNLTKENIKLLRRKKKKKKILEILKKEEKAGINRNLRERQSSLNYNEDNIDDDFIFENSSSSSENEEENSEDDSKFMDASFENEQKKNNKRKGKQPIDDSEEDTEKEKLITKKDKKGKRAIIESSEEDENTNNENSTYQPPSKPGRKRVGSVASTSSAAMNSSSSAPTKQKKHIRFSNQRQKELYELHLKQIKRQKENHDPDDWVYISETHSEPYLPQLGDEVVYIMEGHKQYLEMIPEVYKKSFSRNYPWTQDFTMEEVEFCIITKIEFFLGPPLHCQLTLKQLAPIHAFNESQSKLIPFSFVPKREALDPLKRSFTLKYYYIPGESDFLMLYSDYIHYMAQPFDLNKEVVIRNSKKTGMLVGISCEDPQTKMIKTPWKCFEVRYIDDEKQEEKVEDFSPWEILDKTNESDAHLDNFIDNGLTEEEERRYQTGYQTVRGLDPFFPFLDEVDYDTYTTYLDEIPYPMAFNIINERVEFKYYRSLQSLLWDIKLIKRNAMKFNDKRSAIYQIADKYLTLFYKYVEGEVDYLEEIKRLAQEEMKDEEDEEVAGSSNKKQKKARAKKIEQNENIKPHINKIKLINHSSAASASTSIQDGHTTSNNDNTTEDKASLIVTIKRKNKKAIITSDDDDDDNKEKSSSTILQEQSIHPPLASSSSLPHLNKGQDQDLNKIQFHNKNLNHQSQDQGFLLDQKPINFNSLPGVDMNTLVLPNEPFPAVQVDFNNDINPPNQTVLNSLPLNSNFNTFIQPNPIVNPNSITINSNITNINQQQLDQIMNNPVPVINTSSINNSNPPNQIAYNSVSNNLNNFNLLGQIVTNPMSIPPNINSNNYIPSNEISNHLVLNDSHLNSFNPTDHVITNNNSVTLPVNTNIVTTVSQNLQPSTISAGKVIYEEEGQAIGNSDSLLETETVNVQALVIEKKGNRGRGRRTRKKKENSESEEYRLEDEIEETEDEDENEDDHSLPDDIEDDDEEIFDSDDILENSDEMFDESDVDEIKRKRRRKKSQNTKTGRKRGRPPLKESNARSTSTNQRKKRTKDQFIVDDDEDYIDDDDNDYDDFDDIEESFSEGSFDDDGTSRRRKNKGKSKRGRRKKRKIY
ncbi:WD40 repeat-like protein [Piromyces finnis]|uniref:WD40 repeat-like protein n=1 Tax=Piromyces finnis TaxID=1754191 RepID=A0A1Y1UV84_9FUNG|nr:WD40 repeat-like protein [Piromyces finnis]|eukprot:ORX41927.1 WD40 repeat-like protein [Piromyces finnis]